MFERILVLCDGNICRSPTVAALLRARKPDITVESAGLIASDGHDMDKAARAVAAANGLDCGPHSSQKLSSVLCMRAELILVMEKRQRDRVIERYPEASGKTFLLTHWTGSMDVPDPFQRSKSVYEQIYPMMASAVDTWITKL